MKDPSNTNESALADWQRLGGEGKQELEYSSSAKLEKTIRMPKGTTKNSEKKMLYRRSGGGAWRRGERLLVVLAITSVAVSTFTLFNHIVIDGGSYDDRLLLLRHDFMDTTSAATAKYPTKNVNLFKINPKDDLAAAREEVKEGMLRSNRKEADNNKSTSEPNQTTTSSTTTTNLKNRGGGDDGGGGGDHVDDNDDTIQEGVRSTKPWSFFQKIRDGIDGESWETRCTKSPSYRRIFQRDYKRSFQLYPQHDLADDVVPKNRRIFYGSLIADEPWELFDIIGTETYGIFEAMVFVESNRTASFAPRPFRHYNSNNSTAKLKSIFGTERLEIRQYINEDKKVVNLTREHLQRHQILRTWKEMGMKPDDIGLIADVDEMFSRDFLRAIQTCPYVAPLDYTNLKCHPKQRIRAMGTMYEGSPNCITYDRDWKHPDMVPGACIEEVGDETVHPKAKREYYWLRADGYATGQGFEAMGTPEYKTNYEHIRGDHFPLFSAADFRMTSGGYQVKFASFHLHNWFPDFAKIRHKYNTYAHARKDALTKPLHEIHSDLKLMEYCLRNLTDAPVLSGVDRVANNNNNPYTETQNYQRVWKNGGFDETSSEAPFPKDMSWPIYFHDADYRKRKHEAAQINLEADREKRLARLTPEERVMDDLQERIEETKRQVWKHQKLGRFRKMEIAQRKVVELEKDLHDTIQENIEETKRKALEYKNQGKFVKLESTKTKLIELQKRL